MYMLDGDLAVSCHNNNTLVCPDTAMRNIPPTTLTGGLQVPSEMKKGMVKGVFTSVAHNYDVMNDLMSAGEQSTRDFPRPFPLGMIPSYMYFTSYIQVFSLSTCSLQQRAQHCLLYTAGSWRGVLGHNTSGPSAHGSMACMAGKAALPSRPVSVGAALPRTRLQLHCM